MIKIKIMFINDSPFEDREELFSTNDENEATVMAVEKMTIEEVKYLFGINLTEIKVKQGEKTQ